jgi:hypothetical protein
MTTSDLTWKPHHAHHGERAVVKFPNGYGASVLRGGEPYTYTENGTYELAVFKNGNICYTTWITGDVLGNLSETELNEVLNQIEQLPR